MDAWRTSCPKLPVWEDASDRGFVTREQVGVRWVVRITPAGLAFLQQQNLPGPDRFWTAGPTDNKDYLRESLGGSLAGEVGAAGPAPLDKRSRRVSPTLDMTLAQISRRRFSAARPRVSITA